MRKTSALIITHNPSQDLEHHLDTLYKQVDQIILVDNGSGPETKTVIEQQIQRRGSKLKTILNHQNLGVATALNQGFSLAIHLGYDYIMAFDQDSVPTPGMTKAMLHAYGAHLAREKIAIVAPVIEDPSAGIITSYLRPRRHFFFERKSCTGQVLEDVSIVITSGSMHNLKIYEQVGPFRDDFFIDYVDTEYCLRVKQRGFNIIVACNARLHHKLGDQKKIRLGPLEMRPTSHSITRWYYISRNRIPTIRQYGLRFPHWLLFELLINSYGFLRMLLLEDYKLGKIIASFLGCLDGVTGQKGIIPDSRKRILSKFE